jgi:hypothetical protein
MLIQEFLKKSRDFHRGSIREWGRHQRQWAGKGL